MLRVVTLSTLFPDASRPRLGPFVERQTLELAAHPDVELKVIAPVGIPMWPATFHPHYAERRKLPAREMWKGLDVHRPRYIHWPGTQGRYDATGMAKAALAVLHVVRKDFAFDVIDAEFFFPDGPAAAELKHWLGVPISIKARGADIHYWGSQGPTAEQVLDAGLKADGMLAVSAALKADMVALGMPEEKIRVHYTGVDLDLFKLTDRVAAKATLGLGPEPLIVTTGALIARKRQALVIEALTQLPSTHLALIGDGENREKLEALARELGVAGRVRFLGSLTHEKIANWLAAADVMALASASEGLANAWVEALACGTPIVITHVGGAPELLDRPEAGALVEPDPTAIAAAIATILAHPPERTAVRACAERFTWTANRDALYTHLSSLASG
jgi:teichuronic acid biosynthesis glycosyltransferase TuaC